MKAIKFTEWVLKYKREFCVFLTDLTTFDAYHFPKKTNKYRLKNITKSHLNTYNSSLTKILTLFGNNQDIFDHKPVK